MPAKILDGLTAQQRYVQKHRDRAYAATARWIKRNPAYRRAKAKRWREKNPDRTRELKLQSMYGLAKGEYAARLNEQGGVCAICKQPETSIDPRWGGGPKRLCVDHDAVTGVVRGLLCYACNTGIGKLRHSQQILQSAIQYVKEGGVQHASSSSQ